LLVTNPLRKHYTRNAEEVAYLVLQPKPAKRDAAALGVDFRDGSRSEVQNFAIVGLTLWVFNTQRARKIRISDLDVEATNEVNADRGIDVSAHQQPLTAHELWVARKKPTIFAFRIRSAPLRASTFLWLARPSAAFFGAHSRAGLRLAQLKYTRGVAADGP
jgi:hypothetical protein